MTAIAMVSTQIAKVDYNQLSADGKREVKDAIVQVYADVAGVPKVAVRDTQGHANSVAISPSSIGGQRRRVLTDAPSAQAGIAVVTEINVPSDPLSEDIVKWLVNDTTKNSLVLALYNLPAVKSAVNTANWPLIGADIFSSAKLQNRLAFSTLDKGLDGTLNWTEFQAAAAQFAEPLTPLETANAFSGLDWNKDQQLSPLEFIGYSVSAMGETPALVRLLEHPMHVGETLAAEAVGTRLDAKPSVAAAPGMTLGEDGLPITMADFNRLSGQAPDNQVFTSLDSNHDSTVNLDEVVAAGVNYRPQLNSSVSEFLFRGIDVNHDDKVTPNEFSQVRQSGTLFLEQRRRLSDVPAKSSPIPPSATTLLV